CAALFRRSGIEHNKIGRRQILDAVAPGAKIVEQHDVRDVQFFGKDGSVHGPGQIGGANAVFNYGTGNAESSGANFFVAQMGSGDAREFLGDEIKLGEVFTAKTLLENRSELGAALGKKREVAFGAAHVASQNHEVPLRGLKRFNWE